MVNAYLVFVQIVGQTADENFVRGIRYNGADDTDTWCYCGLKRFSIKIMCESRMIINWQQNLRNLPPEPIELLSVMPGIGW